MSVKNKSKKAPVKKKTGTRVIKKQATTALTDKHRLFAMHYALTGDAQNSAKKAGFTAATAKGKSYKWVGQSRAESFYPELFDLVEQVKEQQIKPKLEKQFDITADKVLNELARIGFSDVRKFYNERNALIDVKDLDDDCAAVVSSIEVDELWDYDPVEEKKVQIGHTKKLKMWDKKGALEMLGKHLGLWKDDGREDLPANISINITTGGNAPIVADGH